MPFVIVVLLFGLGNITNKLRNAQITIDSLETRMKMLVDIAAMHDDYIKSTNAAVVDLMPHHIAELEQIQNKWKFNSIVGEWDAAVES